MSLETRVRAEVEGLHEFFVDWFSGRASVEAFEDGFDRRFVPEFTLVPPAGGILGLDALRAAIRDKHGSNPDFRIAIRGVSLVEAGDQLVIATYEEWQRNAVASTPPDNGRIATVVFTPDLRWRHVHETWLPAERIAAGPYDF